MNQHLVPKLISCALLLGSLAWAASEADDAAQRLRISAEVLKEIAAAPDTGIPEEVMAHSKCIIVIPHLVKAGLIVGGKYGRGVAACRTSSSSNSGWSAPAFITVGGGSMGMQIGAEDVDLVMLVMNDKGLQQLLSSKFELSVEGSIAAGPVGRHASVGTNWKLDTEILTYARSKGVFAGKTLEGAVIEQDADATKAVYGSDVTFNKILIGQVGAPAPAAPFLHEVAALSHQATAQEARQQIPQDRK